jgi:pyrophosphate--fructose-6-phosphate 1-phosphotransferase
VQGKRVAVLFSGGPAAGGHNVVCGLKRVLGAGNTLFGVKAGPKGLLKGSLFEITDANVDFILNTGGFDFLGSDRTKIKSDEQFAQVRETCIKHQLDAIVVVGGDDSNTNAAVLAESLFTGVKADGSGVQVIGVPKTIDGDLQIGDLLSISFGFDTATRIYSEMVGNILQDTSSSLKYWHFVKLMGRSASHVALEVALQTKPAITLISEEIAAKQESLASIIDRIAQVIVERSHKGMNYGVLLAPEGLIEFIPEMNAMIAELNDVLAHHARRVRRPG